MESDVLIIGAGASGLMAAITAGGRGRRVVVLDHGEGAGRKLRITGGGRCNFTNFGAASQHYVSANPDFCRSALSRFTPGDIIAMLRAHGIGCVEKEEGQLFLDREAGAIVGMLKKECGKAGVGLRFGCRIAAVRKGESFETATDAGKIRSSSVIVATGGLSYPETGASGLGHAIARQFGLRVVPPRPGLVPLLYGPEDLAHWKELSGISCDAEVSCSGKRFLGRVLFTHKGLSGPAILQISLYWNKGEPVILDLSPQRDLRELFHERKGSRKELRNVLAEFFPDRLAIKLCPAHLASKPLNVCTHRELDALADHLHRFEFRPAKTAGYAQAEVTAGGVDTRELSSKTMESKKAPGLFFVGEVIDVTGELGGYNLHWAWASGQAAGQYA